MHIPNSYSCITKKLYCTNLFQSLMLDTSRFNNFMFIFESKLGREDQIILGFHSKRYPTYSIKTMKSQFIWIYIALIQSLITSRCVILCFDSHFVSQKGPQIVKHLKNDLFSPCLVYLYTNMKHQNYIIWGIFHFNFVIHGDWKWQKLLIVKSLALSV